MLSVPPVPLGSMKPTATSLQASLPLPSEFTDVPGLLESHLRLDDDGLPLGSVGAASPLPSPLLGGAETVDILVALDVTVNKPASGDEMAVVLTLPTLFLRSVYPVTAPAAGCTKH